MRDKKVQGLVHQMEQVLAARRADAEREDRADVRFFDYGQIEILEVTLEHLDTLGYKVTNYDGL